MFFDLKKKGLHLLYIIVMCNIGQLIFLRCFSLFTCIYDDLMILIQQHIWDGLRFRVLYM
jgi:hypothetical protein